MYSRVPPRALLNDFYIVGTGEKCCCYRSLEAVLTALVITIRSIHDAIIK